jgi:hypothetical protein
MDVYRRLSPKSVKILCLVAGSSSRGRLRIGLWDLASRAAMSESTARRAIRELAEHGLLEFQSSTAGYRFLIPYTKRFTHVPSARLSLLMALSPTAIKVLVSVCRALQPSRSVRMKVQTISDRIGRSVRMVHLALTEIRRSGVGWTIRTGRSSIIVVEPDQPNLFRSQIAQRSQHLLRILSSIPRNELISTISKLGCKDTTNSVRDRHPETRSSERWVFEALRNLKISRDRANVLMSMHDTNELVHAIDLLAGRRCKDAYLFITRSISCGWCRWSA